MRINQLLRTIPHIHSVTALIRPRFGSVYLVGGALRDAYMGNESPAHDFDFCVQRNAAAFARCVANAFRARLVVLDEWQKSYRVVLREKHRILTYDFTQQRGSSLFEDLSLRDFTVNTLTVDLSLPRVRRVLIAMPGVMDDIEHRILRIPQERVLKDDPLRIVRAFSLMARFGFRIERRTYALLVAHKKLLGRVSGERLNEEFFKILRIRHSYRIIKKMSDSFIIDEIIPFIKQQRNVVQGGYHHLDVWGHSLETLLRFESLCERRFSKDEEMRKYLSRVVGGGNTLRDIIKISCLLHDAGKPRAKKMKDKKTIFHAHEKIGAELIEKIAGRLKFSTKEKEVIKRLIFWHLRPGYLADQQYPSARAVYRFFRDTQEEGAAVIFLSLADWRATRGPLTDRRKRARHERIMLRLIKQYFARGEKKSFPQLIDGYDIMRVCKVKPSPVVGRIIKKIREEQALGHIATKREACHLARMLSYRFMKKGKAIPAKKR